MYICRVVIIVQESRFVTLVNGLNDNESRETTILLIQYLVVLLDRKSPIQTTKYLNAYLGENAAQFLNCLLYGCLPLIDGV